MRTKVSTKGQIVLPASIREEDGVAPGDEFEVERVAAGEYRLLRIKRRRPGLLAWLESCPEKGYFVPIESESTDDL